MQRLKFIRFTKGCPLDPVRRLVLSYLAYRAKRQLGATVTKISTALSLDRKTVAKSLKSLGAVENRVGMWYVKEIPPDWYFPRKDGTPAFFWCYQPSESCPLTTVQAIIYWFLSASRNMPLGYAYLAAVFNLSKRKVQYNVTRLKKLEAVRLEWYGMTFKAQTLFKAHWWRMEQKDPLPEKQPEEVTAMPTTTTPTKTHSYLTGVCYYDGILKEQKELGAPDTLLASLGQKMTELSEVYPYTDSDLIDHWYQNAKYKHDPQKYQSRYCVKLLLKMMEDDLSGKKTEEDAKGRERVEAIKNYAASKVRAEKTYGNAMTTPLDDAWSFRHRGVGYDIFAMKNLIRDLGETAVREALGKMPFEVDQPEKIDWNRFSFNLRNSLEQTNIKPDDQQKPEVTT